MDIPPAEIVERKRQDTLHIGGTRPPVFLGLPIKLTLTLIGGAYVIAVNAPNGIAWAAAYLIPGYVGARLAVQKSPYGINVAFAWVQSGLASYVSPFSDRWTWGGASRSPLPTRFQTRPRGMRRVR